MTLYKISSNKLVNNKREIETPTHNLLNIQDHKRLCINVSDLIIQDDAPQGAVVSGREVVAAELRQVLDTDQVRVVGNVAGKEQSQLCVMWRNRDVIQEVEVEVFV